MVSCFDDVLGPTRHQRIQKVSSISVFRCCLVSATHHKKERMSIQHATSHMASLLNPINILPKTQSTPSFKNTSSLVDLYLKCPYRTSSTEPHMPNPPLPLLLPPRPPVFHSHNLHNPRLPPLLLRRHPHRPPAQFHIDAKASPRASPLYAVYLSRWWKRRRLRKEQRLRRRLSSCE